ncbi:hypothetical protein M0Q28_01420 [Patescibacteria group bacterium]|jgi:hypothetical protein|nr:hypothetical protein [Patescibacteria group bacterium]
MNIRWLKFWIVLGALVTLASIVLPPLLIYSASNDVKRYRECVEGKRTDCNRSMVWNLVDAAYLLEQQSGSQVGTALGLDLLGARGGGAMRTSETSPFIEKVEPQGMSNANGVYSAKAGASVTLKTTVSGMVTSVELFQIEGLEGRPTKVGAFSKGSEGVWTASYKLPPGFTGTLEVRAYGDDPKDLAVLALPVAAN